MKKELSAIEKKIKEEIEKVKDERGLDALYKKYLDRKGKFSLFFRDLKKLSPKERTELGAEANRIKKDVSDAIAKKRGLGILKKRGIEDTNFDPTLPGVRPEVGHLHPLTQSIERALDIFHGMGFSIAEGPELEDEWYNFDALNFPDDHPAKEMQDTLFVKQTDGDSLSAKRRLLMRTHTSPVQVRYMLFNEPPFRIVAPGRVFRNEATDASHEVNFYQMEGLMVDKEISIANFKAVIEEFLKSFYQREVKIRLRPSFFPFTEPSFEIDMSCSTCESKGCSVCSQSGWLEMTGAGMVHPNVLKNSGVDPKKWRGFAFGLGWDRIVMMKYKVEDIRHFYGGDLRFLKQF